MLLVATKVFIGLPRVVIVEHIEVSPPLLEPGIVLEMLTPLSEPRDVVDVAKQCLLVLREKPIPFTSHFPSPVEHGVLVDRLVEVNLAGIPHWPPIVPIIWRQRIFPLNIV